jgi:hypothetical protein
MRWRWVMVALLVGGSAAVWWILLQRHQKNKLQEVPQQGEGQIPLMVRHDGPELELCWNTQVSDIENAGDGTLTITDGKLKSKLYLDQAELRSGIAYYWPQAGHVSFKLETGGGAWGRLEVPAWEVQGEEPAHERHTKEHDGGKERHRLAAGKKKPVEQAERAADPGVSKTVRAKHAKPPGAKIPSEWKMPADQ